MLGLYSPVTTSSNELKDYGKFKFFWLVGEFNQDEKISTYVNRVKLFVEANSVADEKKVAVLLTITGVKNYTCMDALLKGLLAPNEPQ